MVYGGGEPVCALRVVLWAQMKAGPAVASNEHAAEWLMRHHRLGEKRDDCEDMRSSPALRVFRPFLWQAKLPVAVFAWPSGWRSRRTRRPGSSRWIAQRSAPIQWRNECVVRKPRGLMISFNTGTVRPSIRKEARVERIRCVSARQDVAWRAENNKTCRPARTTLPISLSIRS